MQSYEELAAYFYLQSCLLLTVPLHRVLEIFSALWRDELTRGMSNLFEGREDDFA